VRFQANRRLILVLAGLIWLELSCVPYISIRMIRPDLFFIFLVFYAFRVSWKNVIAIAFLLGFLRDLLSNTFFGLETASYTVAALGLRFLAIRLDREKRWIQLASLFSFSCAALFIFSCLALTVEPEGTVNSWFLAKSFSISIYTTTLGFVFLPLLDRWLRPKLHIARQYELF